MKTLQHEALDRCHIIRELTEFSLGMHPIITNNKENLKLYNDIQNKLSNLYQKLGKDEFTKMENL